jgi:hypothetical protein
MSMTNSGKTAHDNTCNLAESARQTAESIARAAFVAGGTSAAFQAATDAASVVYFRAAIASALANGVDAGAFKDGLHRLTGSYS